ncbi:MAG: hypothetical protein K9J32_08810 [Synechococcus lacustris]|nr:hypothetical protein [Synechococcus lacustris]
MNGCEWDNQISVITYPRSGKTWLTWYINKNTDLKANFSHYFEVDKSDPQYDLYQKVISLPVITIVRDPIESLSSLDTMEKEVRTQERLDSYLEHYNFFLNNAKMFFLFEDLKDNTNKIIDHICKEFSGNLNIISDSFKDYQYWHLATQNPRKLISSKNSPEYIKNIEKIKNLDLSEHYRLYNLAKERCVVFNKD